MEIPQRIPFDEDWENYWEGVFDLDEEPQIEEPEGEEPCLSCDKHCDLGIPCHEYDGYNP